MHATFWLPIFLNVTQECHELNGGKAVTGDLWPMCEASQRKSKIMKGDETH